MDATRKVKFYDRLPEGFMRITKSSVGELKNVWYIPSTNEFVILSRNKLRVFKTFERQGITLITIPVDGQYHTLSANKLVRINSF